MTYDQVFDNKTGRPIELTNLIINKDDPRLLELLRRKLLEASESSYFDFDSIRLNDTISIDINKIYFTYQKYEIAGGAYGQTVLYFTFDELKPFINRNHPLSYLFE